MHEITHGLLHSIGQVKLRGNEVLVEGLSQQLVGFMVKGENTRHFSDGMNRHMVSIL